MRTTLSDYLRTPRRRVSRLRRTAVARAIRGSNSIEGYDVELDEADAAIDGEEPISADERTFAEIRGYRQALGFVLATAADEYFTLDSSVLRSMHFMLGSHALDKSPGQYRRGEIFVHDDKLNRNVYEGPAASEVPGMVDELVSVLAIRSGEDPFVQAAMAHLNLVMIHPFRDGNGRMARALHTLVLTRAGLSAPELSSIEEWLGRNTDDYYQVLARTSAGVWSPEQDAHLWLKFCLRAHHFQAQTVQIRMARAAVVWEMLDDVARLHKLPERTLDLLFSAVVGFRVRRSTYVRTAEIDERSATRDFKRLADAGLLRAVGETKGRYYVAGEGLDEIVAVRRGSDELVEPYPGFRGVLYA
ncbi:Fic family protein [Sanguibacter gelidistatuariae]|uniref:Fic family protein n=1 Tax=Sanguibacter gelidistatuariae TaxID=1814289 RepID=A0A1G6GUL6_9MICO|nr:Fic family protein [Sanguibacter gelidistatuariae]SDB85658.1 Fic family protein [Sanguibacter gelidistatuariae]